MVQNDLALAQSHGFEILFHDTLTKRTVMTGMALVGRNWAGAHDFVGSLWWQPAGRRVRWDDQSI